MRLGKELAGSASRKALALMGMSLAFAPLSAMAQVTDPANGTAVQDNMAAADAPPQDESEQTEIVVTGFRQSVASAISAKRNASGVVDVIKAEDIAQFPDNNLAD